MCECVLDRLQRASRAGGASDLHDLALGTCAEHTASDGEEAASVQRFPSATRCQEVSQDGLGNFGDDKKTTGASRARQSGLPEPCRDSPPAAGSNVADCGASVESREHRRLPRENAFGGIRAPPDAVLLHTLRPRSATARGGHGAVGA
ncbi:unnamed protein product [Pleuronectes platessa]|uniref:Uncharacterized protein n=1 Tax=Pleuronectes platessa TaxID=8262 RepID=A0A9N7V489_PLEPL|nr:unnamed protein product [Pleuronectes platessa]